MQELVIVGSRNYR